MAPAERAGLRRRRGRGRRPRIDRRAAAAGKAAACPPGCVARTVDRGGQGVRRGEPSFGRPEVSRLGPLCAASVQPPSASLAPNPSADRPPCAGGGLGRSLSEPARFGPAARLRLPPSRTSPPGLDSRDPVADTPRSDPSTHGSPAGSEPSSWSASGVGRGGAEPTAETGRARTEPSRRSRVVSLVPGCAGENPSRTVGGGPLHPPMEPRPTRGVSAPTPTARTRRTVPRTAEAAAPRIQASPTRRPGRDPDGRSAPRSDTPLPAVVDCPRHPSCRDGPRSDPVSRSVRARHPGRRRARRGAAAPGRLRFGRSRTERPKLGGKGADRDAEPAPRPLVRGRDAAAFSWRRSIGARAPVPRSDPSRGSVWRWSGDAGPRGPIGWLWWRRGGSEKACRRWGGHAGRLSRRSW